MQFYRMECPVIIVIPIAENLGAKISIYSELFEYFVSENDIFCIPDVHKQCFNVFNVAFSDEELLSFI